MYIIQDEVKSRNINPKQQSTRKSEMVGFVKGNLKKMERS
jgi:hypothetical protein